jgi:hypothetical protein
MPSAAGALAQRGRAAGAAQTLYRRIAQYGAPRGADTYVLTFQRAHNTDPLAIRLAGRLPRTGVYDARTSAVLTMYTGQAIPGIIAPPPPRYHHVLNPNIPGNAAMMGWNLGVDLQRRGLLHDERQRALIREYQRAINRDPMFPGASWARGSHPLFPKRIRENGRYTPEVARALYLQTPHAPVI